MRCFGKEIHKIILTLFDALQEQVNSKEQADSFKESGKPKIQEKKERQVLSFNNVIRLFKWKAKCS